MRFHKPFMFVLIGILLVLSLVFPLAVKSVTYQEIVDYQQGVSHQQNDNGGRVLGTTIPSPDINSDGIVNSFDMAVLTSHLGEKYAPADLNSDGVVNSVDYSLLASWWFAKR